MTCVTSPMDNIKTRIMNRPGLGIVECAAIMFKEAGIYTFYRGFGP